MCEHGLLGLGRRKFGITFPAFLVEITKQTGAGDLPTDLQRTPQPRPHLREAEEVTRDPAHHQASNETCSHLESA